MESENDTTTNRGRRWTLRGVAVVSPLAAAGAILVASATGLISPDFWVSVSTRTAILAGAVSGSLLIGLMILIQAYRRKVEALGVAVHEHEEREKRARENERHYRVLFEDAMQTAYTDLDRLNQSLREQKDYLQAKMVEQNRTSEELRQSEERWRQLVERNPEGIIITRGRRILYANGVAVSLVSDRDRKSVV